MTRRVASGGSDVISGMFGLDIPGLREKYCRNGATFIAGMTLCEDILSRLKTSSDIPDRLRTVAMKTGVIELLAYLLEMPEERGAEQTVFFTRSQIGIAKQTERIIMRDLSRDHTVREFAEMFSVSEGSVKNYFRGVFGESISRYTSYRRMLRAAELLDTTRLSVLEVAGMVGYENQSKFAGAFRRVYGCSPLEYRRKRRLKL